MWAPESPQVIPGCLLAFHTDPSLKALPLKWGLILLLLWVSLVSLPRAKTPGP